MAGKTNLVKKFIKGQTDELGSVGKSIKQGTQSSSQRFKKNLMPDGKISAKGVANTLLLSDAPKGRTIENLYTGKRLNGKLIGGLGVAGAVALGGGVNNIAGEKSTSLEKPSDIKSVFDLQSIAATKASAEGAAPSENPYMTADGVVPGTKSKAQTLNASGDMVFGMHNKRH